MDSALTESAIHINVYSWYVIYTWVCSTKQQQRLDRVGCFVYGVVKQNSSREIDLSPILPIANPKRFCQLNVLMSNANIVSISRFSVKSICNAADNIYFQPN